MTKRTLALISGAVILVACDAGQITVPDAVAEVDALTPQTQWEAEYGRLLAESAAIRAFHRGYYKSDRSLPELLRTWESPPHRRRCRNERVYIDAMDALATIMRARLEGTTVPPDAESAVVRLVHFNSLEM